MKLRHSVSMVLVASSMFVAVAFAEQDKWAKARETVPYNVTVPGGNLRASRVAGECSLRG